MSTILGWVLMGAGLAAGVFQKWLMWRLRTEQKLQDPRSRAWSRWFFPWSDENWSERGQSIADRAWGFYLAGFLSFGAGLILLLWSSQE
jgi:hypothetical protein